MINYILIGLIFLSSYIVGLVLTPFNYFLRHWVRRRNIIPLWMFLNDTKPYDKNDIDYGDFGRFKHNFIGFYRQNAIRNSHWNLKLLLSPKKGIKYDAIGNLDLLSIRWNYKVGRTFATYKIRGKKYFRASGIKEFLGMYFHYQFGANDYRYLYKVKWGIIKKKR